MSLNLMYYKEDVNIDKFEEEKYEKIKEYFLNSNEHKEVNEFLNIDKLKQNILRWYPITDKDNVLEIGADLGNITEVLCEKAKKVTALEFKKIKGEIIDKRLERFNNLDIVVSDFKNFKTTEKFEYVILVGILEYASIFFKTNNPYKSMINFAAKLLNKNGKMLIALNNRLGIQNFSGNINNFENEGFKSITRDLDFNNTCQLTMSEIKDILQKSAFNNIKFFYPLPTYDIANVIYSDEYIPEIVNDKMLYKNLYNKNSSIVFDESRVLKQICKNGDFEKFTNSYFIEATKKVENTDIKFISYNNFRKEKYQLQLIMHNDYVEKSTLSEYAVNHLKDIEKNIVELKKLGFNIVDNSDGQIIKSNIIEAKQLDRLIIDSLKENKISLAYNYIKDWYNEIKSKLINKKSQHIENDFIHQYNINIDKEKYKELNIIEDGYIDLTFENCFIEDGKFLFYDQEWFFKNIPIEFILYRAINNFVCYNSDLLGDKFNKEQILKKFNILKYLEIFEQMETIIQREILDSKIVDVFNKKYNTLEDINKLMKQRELEKENYEKEILKITNENESYKNLIVELEKENKNLRNELEENLKKSESIVSKIARKIRK